MKGDLDLQLLNARIQPSHAPQWPGKIIAVFRADPMKYIIVYAFDNDRIVPFEWPKSLDEDTAKALIPTLTHLYKARDNQGAGGSNR